MDLDKLINVSSSKSSVSSQSEGTREYRMNTKVRRCSLKNE